MFNAVLKNAVVPLILRLALAVIFIYHGYQKASPDNGWGATWATRAAASQQKEVMEPLRTPMAQLAVAWGELLGGIALALGFLTRLAALGIIGIMAGAIATVHWPNFDAGKGGFEYNFAIITMCLILVLIGGGTLAADRLVRLRRKPIMGQQQPAR